MKILVVGGTFDLNGGKSSGFINKLFDAVEEKDKKLINGGNYKDLDKILSSVINYSVVFWLANVPNELPKIRNVKEIAPNVILVNSKRNDNKYTFKELVKRTILQKANLSFEFKKEGDIFKIKVFDPLGSVWYQGFDIKKAVNQTMKRIDYLINLTRVHTFKSDMSYKLYIENSYLNLIKSYSKVFYKNIISKDDSKELIKTFRCTRGMPSCRYKDYFLVSKRKVKNKFLGKNDFVAVYINNEKIFYYGDLKPSVDTPVHIKLYEKLPNINYIIHSHCYVKDAPIVNENIPCGAIEGVDKIIKIILKNYKSLNLKKYAINLKGHGSFIFGNVVEDLKGYKFIKRLVPEIMY